jgi:tRNA(Ile)-lysidine synthase
VSPLHEEIARFLRDHAIDPVHVSVALSGGADSTALLLALADLAPGSFTLSAVHVNHHLRGEASDLDEAFVRELCSGLDVELRVADVSLDPEETKVRGVEAAARRARYAALEEARAALGAAWIATAHQKNDQAETLVMRFVTGSGIHRLRGIAPLRGHLIRPLLGVSRSEIDAFLSERGVVPPTDEMNADRRFLRSRVRHEIIPLLEALNPRLLDALEETARSARLFDEAFSRMAALLTDDAIERCGDETLFATARIPAIPALRAALLRREIDRLTPSARDVSSRDLARLARELDFPRRRSVSRHLELVPHPRGAALRRRLRTTPGYEYPIEPGGSVEIAEIGARVSLRWLAPGAGITPRSPLAQRFQLPDGSEGPFVIRNRRRGDRFQPLGLHFEKKLKDVFIDRKIDRQQRERIPLLLCAGRIVWIAGVEVAHEFRIADRSRASLEVTVEYGNSRPGHG